MLSAAGAASLVLDSTGKSPKPLVRPASFAVPGAYRVVYKVGLAGAPASTEVLSVERPFESVDVEMSAPPAAGSVYLSTVYRLGAQVTQAANAQALELRVPAAATAFDVRPDIVIPYALRSGMARLIGTATIAGRHCSVYRTAKGLRSGPVALLASGGDHADTCIDAQGLVLRESVYRGGHLTSEKTAVSVAVGAAAVQGVPFGLSGPPTPLAQGGGAFAELTPASRPPGINWALPTPPGFEKVGRWAVIPPQPGVFGQIDAGPPNPLGLPGSLVTEVDDAWVRGTDAIVLEQGQTLNGAAFSAPVGGQQIDLGTLGQGQLQLTASGTCVSAEPDGRVHFIRLCATLPPDAVAALARSMAVVPPGTLTTVPNGTP